MTWCLNYRMPTRRCFRKFDYCVVVVSVILYMLCFFPRNIRQRFRSLEGHRNRWKASGTCQRLMTVLVKTTTIIMSPPNLPPEILDLIVDHLYDERSTLKACGAVSKSWVPRARRHLFFYVRFGSTSPIELWMKAFPDPSSSPVHYTRGLSFYGFETIAAAGAHAWAWVRAFRHVVHLQMVAARWNDNRVSLAPLYGLFPALRSISIHNSRIPPSELLDLICSSPLLRDLQLQNVTASDSTVKDEWSAPLTSPELTGTLRLNGRISPVIWRSLNLLNGRSRLANIVMTCMGGDTDLMADLVLKCSETLESLCIGYLSVGMFPLVSVVGKYLTAARGASHI
jgi:hypothetical protein